MELIVSICFSCLHSGKANGISGVLCVLSSLILNAEVHSRNRFVTVSNAIKAKYISHATCIYFLVAIENSFYFRSFKSFPVFPCLI